MRIAIIIAALALSATANGQTSYPFLFSLYPCGLARGTTVEITLNGEHNYHGAYKVLIEGAGVTGEVIVPKDGWPKPDEKTKKVPVLNQIQLKVTAAADAALGVREFRVATPRGVSSVGQLVIGDEPEILEKQPNNELKLAQEITAPVTINGRLNQGESRALYKFKVQAGEELTFAVICNRIENKIHDLQEHADPILTLRDSTGRELAANDDYYGPDPLLHYKFTTAGEYFIEIRDVRYMANAYWTYRMSVTKRPYVTSTVPLAAKPGTSSEVRTVGFNLPAQTAKLDVPMGTPMGEHSLSLTTSGGSTNPIPLLITDLPVQSLVPGPTAEAPATLAIPSAVSSALLKTRELHRYKFRGVSGKHYVFEVMARRFDSRIDSELKLRNAQGNEITSNDDSGSQDSRIEWTCGGDGDYLLDVKDLQQRGGDNFVYVLVARMSGPDFSIRCDDDKMKLGPGNSGAWYFNVERKFGFNGEIKVEAKGLPPGVTAAPLTIPGNMTRACLVFTCAPDAKVGVSSVEVVATATAPDADGKPSTITHGVIPESEIYSPGGGRALFPVNTQAIAVTEDTDIVIQLSTTNITLAPGGTAKIDVEVKRATGYTKPVTLDVKLQHLGSVYGESLPPGVTIDEGNSKTLLGDNETKGYITLKAAPDAPPITNHPIAILGAVSINFVVKVSYAGPPVMITVTPKK